MRLLKSLIENNEVVWVYCRSKKLAAAFLEQCESEGFCTLNHGKPTELFHHKFYGLFNNLTMGYLSNMIWCMTLRAKDEHIRIDYEKYISDDEDYYCHETNTNLFNFDDLNRIAYKKGLDHKKFYETCGHFNEEQSFEEYNAYIYRYLIESSWHYTPEQVVKRMEWEEYFISQSYLSHTSVSECAVEVGYGCG